MTNENHRCSSNTKAPALDMPGLFDFIGALASGIFILAQTEGRKVVGEPSIPLLLVNYKTKKQSNYYEIRYFTPDLTIPEEDRKNAVLTRKISLLVNVEMNGLRIQKPDFRKNVVKDSSD